MAWRSSRAAVAAAALLLLPVLGIADVVAASETCVSGTLTYNCQTEEVRIREVPLYFSDGNQTIAGTANSTRLTGVFDSWPSTIDAVAVPQDYGARVGCSIEMPVRVSHLNATGAAFPYTPSVTLSAIWESDGRPSVTYSNLVPAVRYRVNATSAQIMNGASEFLFRGAVNISSTITLHVLDVTNAAGDVVMRVGTTQNDEAAFTNGRIYYRLNFPFYSGQNYTFTEYVRFSDQTAPVSDLDMWVCPADAPAFGPTTFTTWPTDAVQGSVRFPPSYSMIMLSGVGQGGGIENVIEANASYSTYQLTMYARGATGSDPSNVTLLVPIRHPLPIDVGVRLFAHRSGNGETVDQNYAGEYTWLHNVTGSLIYSANLNHSAGSGYNEYALYLRFNLTGDDGLAYNMIPPDQDWTANRDGTSLEVFQHGHQLVGITPTNATDSFMIGWLPHFEILDESNATSLIAFDGTVFASKVVAAAIFVLSYLPYTSFAISVAGAALGGEFSAAGFCHGINNVGSAVTGEQLGVNGVPLLCDEELVRQWGENADRLVTGVGCALAAATAGAAALSRSLPLALGATALGVGCAANLADYLPQWVLDLLEIIKRAVQRTGQWISEWLDVWGPIMMVIFYAIGIFLLCFAGAVGVKYLLLLILGVCAPFMKRPDGTWGYERPTQWRLFRKVYRWYFLFWSDLVERRIFGMDVRA